MGMNVTALADHRAGIRPLDETEVEAVSGGFIYIGVVGGAFLVGMGLRWGIDKIASWFTP